MSEPRAAPTLAHLSAAFLRGERPRRYTDLSERALENRNGVQRVSPTAKATFH